MKSYISIIVLAIILFIANDTLAQQESRRVPMKDSKELLPLKKPSQFKEKGKNIQPILNMNKGQEKSIGTKVNIEDHPIIQPSDASAQLVSSEISNTPKPKKTKITPELREYFSDSEEIDALTNEELTYYLQLIERREKAEKSKKGQILTPSKLKETRKKQSELINRTSKKQ